MFRRVGYFHFVSGHDDPIRALKGSLDGCREDCCGSLVVTPEVIDVRADYAEVEQWARFVPEFRDELRDVASEYGITLVAGMRVRAPGDEKYYNASVLISETLDVDLHYKNCIDNGESKGMVRGAGLLSGNPFEIEDFAVGSLVCVDMDTGTLPGVKWELIEGLRKSECTHSVVAIPASTNQLRLRNDSDRKKLRTDWEGYLVVFANSNPNPDADPSLVAFNQEVVSPDPIPSNHVFLYPLAECQ